jgi:hypothetical protein
MFMALFFREKVDRPAKPYYPGDFQDSESSPMGWGEAAVDMDVQSIHRSDSS